MLIQTNGSILLQPTRLAKKLWLNEIIISFNNKKKLEF